MAKCLGLKEPLLMSLIADEDTGRRERALVQYFIKVSRFNDYI